MQSTELIALLPLIVIGAASVALLGIIALRRNHALAAGFTAAALLAAIACLAPAQFVAPRRGPLFVVDGYGLFFVGLILVAGLLIACLAYGYFERRGARQEEFYVLLLLAVAGSGLLAVSSHFVSLFLCLELLSVSLYALIAYPRLRTDCVEAGVKYLVLGSASAAFLLFGAALAYAQLGSMELSQLSQALSRAATSSDVILLAGVGLVFVGAAFKLGVVPFHLWAPDVYQGSSAPVGALIATVSKASMAALVFRYFASGTALAESHLLQAVALVSAASMLVGNLLALLQTNLKRLLAYSSISHLGYVLVALLSSAEDGREAAAFYMAAYVATLVAAFGVMAALSDGEADAEDLERYRGLFWRRPGLGFVLTLAMLSLAGIPLTAGFVGKFYILLAGAERALWTLVLILAAASVIALYYYLRVVVLIYSDAPAPRAAQAEATTGSAALSLALGGSAAAILFLGLFPERLMAYLRAAVSRFVS